MSPRGVATPDVRERLFAAAERVVERDGPGALTSRAVTTEAGCAKGLLHTHFVGLDAFVAELCLDRFARAAAQAQALSELAGQGTVARNLGTVVLALFDAAGPALSGLAMSRAASTLQIREALEGGAPGFTAIEEAITAYLAAEQELGRVAETVDPSIAALAIVGTAHHLLMTSRPGTPDPQLPMARLVAMLVEEDGQRSPGRIPADA
ncbi:TetR/AcrR family transcriptional regulator [Streptomyces sp. ISL-111]|uniref:TetR/AcrR family transcriptional regulator n=1 Tax=unclassified Streptomyces TaxID=2593676 RepID=UPI001BEA1FAF|nr:TetR/AcrR family transcriptional regulator [Streptomyces sp. ISL-111]MBT2376448.1 TetR/AcrR family transcriptional regulator [Streptomyces sp. ISL-111]